jgi:uncharacterized protein with von Willebrand factor type A (vWA) domain
MDKKNLEIGCHRLVIRKVMLFGAKVTVALNPLDSQAKEVLRTFDYRSKGLCAFLGKALGRFVENPSPEVLKEAEGVVIVGRIGLARNPNYVNLEAIEEAFSKEQSHILILNPRSNDWKIDAHKRGKKRED